MKTSESTKKCMSERSARFYRHAAGRLTKKECAKLGALYGGDVHWKFLGSMGDKLAQRKPGEFAASWAAYKTHWRADAARHLAYFFWWYGPNSGMWPGDTLVSKSSETGGG